MAKFKVGDKVKLKRTGEVGTVFRVSTNFGFTNYWVKGLPGGPTNSPVYAEHLLTLANSRVCNAKFKVGDKVVMRDGRKGEVVSSAPGPMGGEMYHVRLEDGRLTDSAERNIAAANSHACNSVRGNTKLKDIDYWFADNGYGDDTLIKYVPSYKKNRCIDFVDRYADTYARDKFYDAMYKLTGIKNRWALNSRACNSSNPVVRNAMNAVAMNAQTLDVGMKIVKWNGRKFVD